MLQQFGRTHRSNQLQARSLVIPPPCSHLQGTAPRPPVGWLSPLTLTLTLTLTPLQAPHYQILTTDVGGEQRFASSVARRLETLGAITRGDRRGGHGMAADLVQFNLDTDLGRAALSLMYDAVAEKYERTLL